MNDLTKKVTTADKVRKRTYRDIDADSRRFVLVNAEVRYLKGSI